MYAMHVRMFVRMFVRIYVQDMCHQKSLKAWRLTKLVSQLLKLDLLRSSLQPGQVSSHQGALDICVLRSGTMLDKLVTAVSITFHPFAVTYRTLSLACRLRVAEKMDAKKLTNARK
mgnify:CR=1 FL=1